MRGVSRAIALLGVTFGLGIVIAAYLLQDPLARRPDAVEIRELMFLVAFEVSVISLGLAKIVACISESMATRETSRSPVGRARSGASDSYAHDGMGGSSILR